MTPSVRHIVIIPYIILLNVAPCSPTGEEILSEELHSFQINSPKSVFFSNKPVPDGICSTGNAVFKTCIYIATSKSTLFVA